MGKKLSIQAVAKTCQDHGFSFVRTVDESTPGKKVVVTCGNGHTRTVWYGNIRKGFGCAKCSGLVKKTDEELIQKIRDKGYFFVKEESGRFFLKCDKGHAASYQRKSLCNNLSCPACSKAHLRRSFKEVREAFSSRGFTLLTEEYLNNQQKLKAVCKNGHDVQITWSCFQQGRGCTLCAKHGFNPEKPGTLYYLKFESNGESAYKVGVTNTSIKRRFSNESTPYKILYSEHYLFGHLVLAREQEILNKYAKFRYSGSQVKLVSGNTELFCKDVLGKDKPLLS